LVQPTIRDPINDRPGNKVRLEHQEGDGESQTYIEVALDYARAGFPATGLQVLNIAAQEADGAMVRYITGYLLDSVSALSPNSEIIQTLPFYYRILSAPVFWKEKEASSSIKIYAV